MDWLGQVFLSIVSAIVNHVVSKVPNYINDGIFSRKTDWKEWSWSIDDEEENRELLGPLESIPFRDIRKLQPHPDFPNDHRPHDVTTYLWSEDEGTKNRRYYVKMGVMDDYIGNGSPYGDICYCLYERKDGQNYIRRFFSRGRNIVQLRKMRLLRIYSSVC